ncbi:hypothetical protein Agub_g6243 [Astrephomene gubernaculifera]|uniref:Uncharacterized protein n=1 Tax=Astrephomene gubernaculifera TaxID=47775 RepID=A0AAD3HLA1_9CHLO|nr:hypothetical protein Agub_g6243 [Astrephomene gubernaculifera]
MASERPRTAPEPPGALKTSPSIYMGPVSPDRKKFANCLTAGVPHCPHHQPKSPFAPSGVSLPRPWLPFSVVPLPPCLVFETWWYEGAERVHMHITYDTATRQCTAGTHVTLGMDVTSAAGAPIDEYDLHVGAELRVAGRKVTLRKAITLPTLIWLDQQARAMLVSKYRLESELAKFRPVVPVLGQYGDAQRAEPFDLSTHQHMPAGGRINLRALYDTVMSLAEQLKQHRVRLPKLPDVVSERIGSAVEALSAPPDWSPDRRESDRREAEARQREALALPPDDTWRHDLMNWLNSIPLAASCCASYPGATAIAATDTKVGGKGDKERGGRGVRGGGVAAAAAAAAGVGGGAALAFNISVLSRYGGGIASAVGSGSGGSGGAGGSRLQGAVASALTGMLAGRGGLGGGTATPMSPRLGLAAGVPQSPASVRVASRQRTGL